MGGPQRVERQRSMGKLPVRERLDLLLDPGSFVELGQLADSMDPALQAERGYLAADGMVAGDRRDRRPPGRHLRLRLHGAGRLDGRGRRDQDGPHPRARPAPTHPDRVAARLGRRADPVVVRVDVRRRRCAVPRAGDAERRRAAGRGDARPLRGRHRLHPGAGRLRPDGQGHVVDGARRPSPRAGGDRRGRHRGGDGRLRGPHQGLRRRRPRGRRRTPSASTSSGATCRSSRRTTRRPRRSGRRSIRSTGGSRSCTTSCRPRRAAPTT